MGPLLVLTGITALLTWLLSLLMLLAWSPSPQPLPSAEASSKKKKNVLLVVAHPDDESMFFAPTLMSLASLGCYHVRILSLSNGNADGLGTIREQEMLSACSFLKVPRENVDILDDPALQDGQSVIWRPVLISQVIERTVTSHNIDMILTFDSYGVSGHPNHTAVYWGVWYFLRLYLRDCILVNTLWTAKWVVLLPRNQAMTKLLSRFAKAVCFIGSSEADLWWSVLHILAILKHWAVFLTTGANVDFRTKIFPFCIYYYQEKALSHLKLEGF